MNIIAKYTHGSADSIDIDTVYLTTDEFTTQSSKEFCSQQEGENANLVNVEDGIISKCYKGMLKHSLSIAFIYLQSFIFIYMLYHYSKFIYAYLLINITIFLKLSNIYD